MSIRPGPNSPSQHTAMPPTALAPALSAMTDLQNEKDVCNSADHNI